EDVDSPIGGGLQGRRVHRQAQVAQHLDHSPLDPRLVGYFQVERSADVEQHRFDHRLAPGPNGATFKAYGGSKMNRLLALPAATAALAVALPAFAALPVGAKAPDFSTAAFQAGKQTSFSLAEARKKGPVVVYFFPAAYTGGCNLEAKAFADAMDQFTANGATV